MGFVIVASSSGGGSKSSVVSGGGLSGGAIVAVWAVGLRGSRVDSLLRTKEHSKLVVNNQLGMVWDFRAKTSCTIRTFLQVAADANETLEMHGHGGTADITAAERDWPLETANQCLALFDFLGTCFVGHIEFGMIIFVNG